MNLLDTQAWISLAVQVPVVAIFVLFTLRIISTFIAFLEKERKEYIRALDGNTRAIVRLTTTLGSTSRGRKRANR